MLKSILKPTITESPREPARTRELLQHPQHLPIRAPPATPPHLEMGTDPPTDAQLGLFSPGLVWGNDAVAVIRENSTGHFGQ